MNKKAFTLIELLVVVLIIGILSAIALPQYNKAVQKARTAQGLVMARTMRDKAAAWVMENDAMPNLLEFSELLDFPDKTCDSSSCKAQNKPSGSCTCTVGDYAVLYRITSTTKHMAYFIYAPNGVANETDAIGSGFYVNTADGPQIRLTCVADKNSASALKTCKTYSTTRLVNNDGIDWYSME